MACLLRSSPVVCSLGFLQSKMQCHKTGLQDTYKRMGHAWSTCVELWTVTFTKSSNSKFLPRFHVILNSLNVSSNEHSMPVLHRMHESPATQFCFYSSDISQRLECWSFLIQRLQSSFERCKNPTRACS